MFKVITEATIDSVKIFPFMMIIFLLIELFEHKFGKNFSPILKKTKFIGPIIGALLGILPQCGFSVMSTLLYAEGTITAGTLISVYLATSDEAIPIILSTPEKLTVLIPLILTKLMIAVISGYIVDTLYKFIKKNDSTEISYEHSVSQYEKSGCCGDSCIHDKFKISDILKHSLSHSIKVLIYVFAVTMLINILLFYTGEETLSKMFLGGSILQPVLAAVVGLIPNCAASVAVTEVFLNGGISFGSAISGLSASAGLGLIVLFKEVKDKKKVTFIISTLLLFSILSGILLNNILPPKLFTLIK